MKPLLELQNVSYAYHTQAGETPAISNLSFSVYQGEFVSVVGPSGCGKSTLLSLITGLLKREAGSLLFHGEVADKPPIHMGYMLQKDQLLEWRTIYQNILLGPEIHHRLTKETKAKATTLLKQYGLWEFAHARPGELSGGMRQRVALIRTLMLDPDLLLLDEPFSALDYQTRLTVGNEIGQIIREKHKTALLVTHDLSEAISLSDRVLVLSNRPATLKANVPLSFPSEQDRPLARRDTPAFKTYFQQIWKELNDHG